MKKVPKCEGGGERAQVERKKGPPKCEGELEGPNGARKRSQSVRGKRNRNLREKQRIFRETPKSRRNNGNLNGP